MNISKSVAAATEAAKRDLVVEDKLNDDQIQEKIKELQRLYSGWWKSVDANKDNQLINIILSLYSTVMAENADAEGLNANIERILKLFIKKEKENKWIGKKNIQTAVNDVSKMLDLFRTKAQNRLFLRLGGAEPQSGLRGVPSSDALSARAMIVWDIIKQLSSRLRRMDVSSFSEDEGL